MNLVSKIGGVVLFIVAAVLIIFGFLVVLGSTDPVQGNPSWLMPGVCIIGFGLLLVGGGIALVYFNSRRARAAEGARNVTLNIDLSGNVHLDTLKCKSCGGTLSKDYIAMVAGAPMVTCPFCNTSYQLTEEPKW